MEGGMWRQRDWWCEIRKKANGNKVGERSNKSVSKNPEGEWD